MIKHYFLVAFRNLRKYKTQTLISIIGIAVGLTCFALASLWMRYEMSYDSFHKDADRTYQLYIMDKNLMYGSFGRTPYTAFPLANYLKEKLPEVEEATTISINSKKGQSKIEVDGEEYLISRIRVVPSFPDVFDVRVIEGDWDFLVAESKKSAITKKKAQLIFGKENPIGKTYIGNSNEEYTISAIVEDWNKNSNFYFDIIEPLPIVTDWMRNWTTIIKLKEGTDVKAFEKKLYELDILEDGLNRYTEITMLPLTAIHYRDLNRERNVQFNYIVFFAVFGILIILSSLFNTFTLFVNRIHIRQKEMMIRLVCGSSWNSLFYMLMLEFLITLLFAILFGFMLIKLVLSFYKEVSLIEMSTLKIYGESLYYIGAIILLALIIFGFLILLLKRRSLQKSIQRGNKNFIRNLTVVFQLIISIGFIFCTIVIFKQVYYLHNTDLGFEYKNTLWLHFSDKDISPFSERIKQLPEVKDIMTEGSSLMPVFSRTMFNVEDWEGRTDPDSKIHMEALYAEEDYYRFYNIQLISGELLKDTDPEHLVLINETAAKAFGWDDPVGKKLRSFTVKGVVKDIHRYSPTLPVKPTLISGSRNYRFENSILFIKYTSGSEKIIAEKIHRILAEEFPELYLTRMEFVEDVYDQFFTSERVLLKILSFLSVISILISLFGFFSIVSLNLEEKRKEMAIRKVNGATTKNVIGYYFREYIFLLVIGSFIAFPLGYLLMRRWIESYVLQTTIHFWIYLVVFVGMLLTILLTVGWKVVQTSKENPAKVLKSE